MSTHPTHTERGLDCWCRPRYYLACDDCTDGCWKCQDGKIEIDRDEAQNIDRVVIIVHNKPTAFGL